MKTIPISMNECLSQVTLHIKVTGQRPALARLRLGIAILRLGAAIMGVRSQIDVDIDAPKA